jgi:hypothetical protein
MKKRPRRRAGSQPTIKVLRSGVIALVNRVEVCRGDPPDGTQGQRRAVEEEPPCECPFCESESSQESSLPPWAGPATRCLNAYIRRDYTTCIRAGTEALSHQCLPTVGLVTILALRREGRLQEAEGLGRALLRCGAGPGGMFFLLLMLLDGALEPERLLGERVFAGIRVGVSRELECQVYFYWGAKLLTEGKVDGSLRPLLLCVETECHALERRLADADLATARALQSTIN